MQQPPPQSSRSVRFFRACVIAVVLITIGASLGYCTEPSCSDSWSSDIHQAISASKAKKQPIMLVFTRSDTCIYCKKLEREIVDTPEFCAWSQDVVKFKIDFPQVNNLPAERVKQNNSLKKKFADLVTSYPTILLVDSNGTVLGKTGYTPGGSSNWIANTNQLIKN